MSLPLSHNQTVSDIPGYTGHQVDTNPLLLSSDLMEKLLLEYNLATTQIISQTAASENVLAVQIRCCQTKQYLISIKRPDTTLKLATPKLS